MVEVPSGPISLWPPGSGAKVLRAWAGRYGTQYGFTSPLQDQSEQFHDSQEQGAFRHAFVASAFYLETYDHYRKRGFSDHEADRRATARTLALGNMNELWGANPLAQHLKDYWNNYEGVSLAREIAAKQGADISNDDLAQIVAEEINRSIQSPIGKSRFILYDHDRNQNVHTTDPRLDVNNYDVNRLPNEGWGIGPYPHSEGYVPPAVIQAFPKLYQGFPPAPSPSPQGNPPTPAPNAPGPALSPPSPPEGGGRTDLDPTGDPMRVAAANRAPAVAMSSVGRQADQRQQPILIGAFGLPQHVIDAGNLLRANGYEITPRTMYLAHVLGPQAAVDLIKRTGSTYSPQVPSPDAATGDQMRAWVRALRLGPAAQAGLVGGLASASDAGAAMPNQPDDNVFATSGPFA